MKPRVFGRALHPAQPQHHRRRRTTRATSTWASCGTRSASTARTSSRSRRRTTSSRSARSSAPSSRTSRTSRPSTARAALRAGDPPGGRGPRARQDGAHLPRGHAHRRTARSTSSSRSSATSRSRTASTSCPSTSAARTRRCRRAARSRRKREIVARIGPPLAVADLRRLTAGMIRRPTLPRGRASSRARAVLALRDGERARPRAHRRAATSSAPEREHPLVDALRGARDEVPRGRGRRADHATTSRSATTSEAKWTVRVDADGCEVTPRQARGRRRPTACSRRARRSSPRSSARRTCRARRSSCPGAVKSNDVALLHDLPEGLPARMSRRDPRHRRDRLPRRATSSRSSRARARGRRALPQRRPRARRPRRRRRRGDVLDAASVRAAAEGCDGALPLRGQGLAPARGRRGALPPARRGDEDDARRVRAPPACARVVVARTSGVVAVSEDPDDVANEDDRRADRPPRALALLPLQALRRARRARARAAPASRSSRVNPTLLLGPGDVHGSSTEDVRALPREARARRARGRHVASSTRATRPRRCCLAMERGRRGRALPRRRVQPDDRATSSRGSRASRACRRRGCRCRAALALARVGRRLLERAAASAWPHRRAGRPVSVEMAQCFWYVDASKAERELGWTPRDPGETLADTVEDLRARGVVWPTG